MNPFLPFSLPPAYTSTVVFYTIILYYYDGFLAGTLPSGTNLRQLVFQMLSETDDPKMLFLSNNLCCFQNSKMALFFITWNLSAFGYFWRHSAIKPSLDYLMSSQEPLLLPGWPLCLLYCLLPVPLLHLYCFFPLCFSRIPPILQDQVQFPWGPPFLCITGTEQLTAYLVPFWSMK